MKVKSYAKINLGLKVIGKREDGYHDLEMIMVNVDLYDVMEFKENDDVIVNMDKPICDMKDNIVYKTIMLIKKKYNINKGIEVNIEKRIPDGGGMGGGSSNAATTIKALNKMWGLKICNDEMHKIAEELGSDVPFFIYNQLALVSGRGEKIKLIDKNIDRDILLAFPRLKCSTKEIFKKFVLCDNKKNIKEICDNLENDYYKYLFNDLENTVCQLYPKYELNILKKELEEKFDCCVLMSGSGSSFFIIGNNCLEEIYNYLSEKNNSLTIIKNKTISSCKDILLDI